MRGEFMRLGFDVPSRGVFGWQARVQHEMPDLVGDVEPLAFWGLFRIDRDIGVAGEHEAEGVHFFANRRKAEQVKVFTWKAGAPSSS